MKLKLPQQKHLQYTKARFRWLSLKKTRHISISWNSFCLTSCDRRKKRPIILDWGSLGIIGRKLWGNRNRGASGSGISIPCFLKRYLGQDRTESSKNMEAVVKLMVPISAPCALNSALNASFCQFLTEHLLFHLDEKIQKILLAFKFS